MPLIWHSRAFSFGYDYALVSPPSCLADGVYSRALLCPPMSCRVRFNSAAPFPLQFAYLF
eukprot:7352416-Pyramimonas_sp.AAC.1